MHIHQLALSGFRNLQPQSISFEKRVSLVTGRNGQGKTSLLEAVFFLAHAKSFRTSKIRDVLRWGEDGASSITGAELQAKVETADGLKEIECRISGGKSKARINGIAVEQASGFYGQLSCVVFTPDELQIVKGPPQGRRKYLDRILVSVDRGYVDKVVQYHRAVKSRNAVLHEMKDRRDSASTLAPWDTLVARFGVEIIKTRLELIEEIQPLVLSYYQQLSSSSESIAMEYSSKLIRDGVLCSAEEVENLLRDVLDKDLMRKSTALGPHRDDLNLNIDSGFGNKLARSAASQGQARSYALALKMASIEYLSGKLGEPPVVLLDDVESELDEHRREALYRLLSELQSQTILTATELSQELRALSEGPNIFVVEEGRVEKRKCP